MPDIPVAHPDARNAQARQRLAQALRNHDRTVAPARAADGDRQVALALRDIERDDVPHVLLEALDERASAGITLHELDHCAIAAGSPAQRRDEMRVRQAPR